MVGDYLAIWGEPPPTEEFEGWRCAEQRQGFQVWVRGDDPPPVRGLAGGGLLIGEAYASGRRLAGVPIFADARPQRVCERLLQTVWGRYVALFGQRSAPALFRDPSGGLECVFWVRDKAICASSARWSDLPHGVRPQVSLDWTRVAGLLISPTAVGGALALNGATSVVPGMLTTVNARHSESELLWRPDRFIDPSPVDLAAAAAALVAETEAAVNALAAPEARALAEVSGGLDSAIVTHFLARARGQEVAVWLNNRTSDPRGDERPYARAVAAEAGIALCELEKGGAALEDGVWRAVADGWRPPFAGLDAERDATVAALCQEKGLTQIFTGQGGDIVFYQEPAPQILAEAAFSSDGPGVWRTADRLARWTRRSGWEVLWRGWLSPRRASSVGRASILHPDVRSEARHPWLDAVRSAPAAKRIQVFGLAALLNRQTPSLRGRVAEVLNPLLAQPLVELCLRLPAHQLTEHGRRDRALARKAFEGRVPDVVLQRNAKGELSRFYGRQIAASLRVLKPLLLDGELARQGILNREALEAALDPDDLLVRGEYAALLQAAMLETWAATWTRQAQARA